MLDNFEKLHPMARELGLVAIYLHGSQLAGTSHATSDIDLAVLGPPSWTAIEFERAAARVSADVARLLGRADQDVDVQDLRSAPAAFSARVVTRGRLLYVGNGFELARFQARCLPESWDEAIFLEPILEAMRRRVREGHFAA